MVCLFVSVMPFGGSVAGDPPEKNPGGRANTERPNVVLIVTDDLDKGTMERLPGVKKVVGGGADFEKAYVSDPFCCPSRASILTGKYVKHHGVKSNDGPSGGAAAFRRKGHEPHTIATALDDAGYRTALAGKYFNGNDTRIPEGWDDWQGWVGDRHSGENLVNSERGTKVCDPADCHDTDYLANRAAGFVESSAGTPFFLYLAFNAPHDPELKYIAPRYRDSLGNFGAAPTPSYRERDLSDKPRWVRENRKVKTKDMQSSLDRVARNRARAMLSVRDAYEKLVESLEENGELDETYIIFTSDHGVYVGDHGLGVGKRSPYLHDTEVPLYIRGPGIEAGKNSALVSNIDLYPTIMEMTGTRYDPSGIDGRSILPLAEGRDAPRRNRVFVEGYSEASRNSPYPIPSFTSVIEENRTYTRYATGEEELYDLRKDPYQLRNVAGSRKASLDPLRREVASFRDCRPGECRSLEDR